MNISDIRAGLRTLVESEKATYAQIARESGVAAGTLLQQIAQKPGALRILNGQIIFCALIRRGMLHCLRCQKKPGHCWHRPQWKPCAMSLS